MKSIIKPKIAGESAVSTMPVLFEEVDVVGKLDIEIEVVTSKLKALTNLRSGIVSELLVAVDATTDAGEKALLQGERFALEFGAKTKVATVKDKMALYEELENVKEGLFFDLAKVGVTDIRSYLSKLVIDKVLKEERTGSRRVKVIPKQVSTPGF